MVVGGIGSVDGPRGFAFATFVTIAALGNGDSVEGVGNVDEVGIVVENAVAVVGGGINVDVAKTWDWWDVSDIGHATC